MIRRYLWIILLLIAVPCGAMNPHQAFMMVNKGAAAASCTTSNDTELASFASTPSNATLDTSGVNFHAQSLTITSGTTVTQWNLQFNKGSATTGNVVCSLYSNNAGDGKPNAELSSTTVTVAISSITNDASTAFVLSTPKVVNDTSVHVVCRGSGLNSSAYLRRASTDIYAGGVAHDSTDSGSTWAAQTYDLGLIFYGCAP